MHDWDRLVGQQLARVSRPVSVDRGGTLWVRVRSGAWMQELRMMSPTILRALVDRGRYVRAIRWIAWDEAPPIHDQRP